MTSRSTACTPYAGTEWAIELAIENDVQEIFLRALKFWMEQNQDMKPGDLMRLMKRDASTYSHWVAKKNAPTMRDLPRLAKILGIPAWLLLVDPYAPENNKIIELALGKAFVSPPPPPPPPVLRPTDLEQGLRAFFESIGADATVKIRSIRPTKQ